MTLQELINCKIELVFSAKDFSANVTGRLSQKNCCGGDYAVIDDVNKTLVVFNESVLDRINDALSPKYPPLVFIKLLHYSEI